MEDKILLEIYVLGFAQELQGVYNNPYKKDTLEYRAYLVGSDHATLDIDSPNEEILKCIKNV